MNRKEARVVRKLLALSRQEVYESLMPNQVNGVLLDSSCIKYLKKKKGEIHKSTTALGSQEETPSADKTYSKIPESMKRN